ncbi:MAG: hypothetical protein IPL49_22295 [Saprospirales bacterium]|nr:hypothetical protein [Saprospirales bacterium]
MFKLLIYGLLAYFGYRYFIQPLLDPPKDLPRRDDPDRIEKKGSRFSQEEGEFIGYEESDEWKKHFPFESATWFCTKITS